jgi:hypothetical protein
MFYIVAHKPTKRSSMAVHVLLLSSVQVSGTCSDLLLAPVQVCGTLSVIYAGSMRQASRFDILYDCCSGVNQFSLDTPLPNTTDNEHHGQPAASCLEV